MISQEIRKILYESNSPWLYLKPMPEINETDLNTILKTKPGEINIILSRTVQLIKNDHAGKTKRQVIIEILDVLSRSFIARQFVSLGISQEYKIFKGFPIRKGDFFENIPQVNTETELKPKANFISWTTDANVARENAIQFDKAKGNPLGGMLVKTSIDGAKILWDINAVIRAVRKYYDNLIQYNQSAAPGMSISKTNVEFLAKEAQDYNDTFEVLTSTEVKVVVVEDTWKFVDNTITWTGSNTESEQPKEEIKETKFTNDYQLDEGFFDIFSKLFNKSNTLGKKWVDAMKKKYSLLKKIAEMSNNQEPVNEELNKINKMLESLNSLCLECEQ